MVKGRAGRLNDSCKVIVTWDKSEKIEEGEYAFKLNGADIGSLKSGKILLANTMVGKNIITASDDKGKDSKPYMFDAASGGIVDIHFKKGQFRPSETRATAGRMDIRASRNPYRSGNSMHGKAEEKRPNTIRVILMMMIFAAVMLFIFYKFS